MDFGWWRSRMMELAASIIIATGVIEVSKEVSRATKENVPSEVWFEVNDLYVPDYDLGEDPEVIYARTIRERFDVFWITEYQRQTQSGLWATVCSGFGQDEYDPGDVIVGNKVTLGWLVGRQCDVGPGRFRLRVTFTMVRPSWPAKRTYATSNAFEVRNPYRPGNPPLVAR